MKLFSAIVEPIALYNSEIWTMNKGREGQIDVSQRKFLRRILNIRWPDTISNEDLYARTHTQKWSKKIKTKRQKWIGHMLRLPLDMPVNLAISEYMRPVCLKRGRRTKTYWDCILEDLNELQVVGNLEEIRGVVRDKKGWANKIKNLM